MRPLLQISLLTATLYACSESAPPPAATVPQKPVTDMQQFMEWILEPPADVIWDSAGTIITAEGRTELAPTTDEGWTTVIHAAAALAEAGNLLMIPGRSMGQDWDEYSAGLTEAAKLALAAAQAQDAEALFDAGGAIYQVCRACHNQYWPEARRD
ncbi:MAG: hypothetical protein R3228_06710 [Halioglobus sp.]|nr:hypothetical protein [Halioglobus sp.]